MERMSFKHDKSRNVVGFLLGADDIGIAVDPLTGACSLMLIPYDSAAGTPSLELTFAAARIPGLQAALARLAERIGSIPTAPPQ